MRKLPGRRRGLFVVATSDRRVVALEPDGDVRWTVTRPRPVTDARYPSGFRIAYREGNTVRVVVGDGTNDHLLARHRRACPARLAPRCESQHPRVRRRRRADPRPRRRYPRRALVGAPCAIPASLVWSPDDSRLLALSADGTSRIYDAGGRDAGLGQMDGAAYSPGGDARPTRPTILRPTLRPSGSSRTAASKRSSPVRAASGISSGRRTVVGCSSPWPAADQWLFFRAPSVRGVVSVPGIAREFDPGGQGTPASTLPFPRVSGWAPS